MGKQFEVGKNYIATKMETYLKENKPVRESYFFVEKICEEDRCTISGTLHYEVKGMEGKGFIAIEPLWLKFNTHDEFFTTTDCDEQEWIIHVEEVEAKEMATTKKFEVGRHYLCEHPYDEDNIYEKECVIITPTKIDDCYMTVLLEYPVHHICEEIDLHIFEFDSGLEFVEVLSEEDVEDDWDVIHCCAFPMSEERYQRLVKPFVAN